MFVLFVFSFFFSIQARTSAREIPSASTMHLVYFIISFEVLQRESEWKEASAWQVSNRVEQLLIKGWRKEKARYFFLSLSLFNWFVCFPFIQYVKSLRVSMMYITEDHGEIFGCRVRKGFGRPPDLLHTTPYISKAKIQSSCNSRRFGHS